MFENFLNCDPLYLRLCESVAFKFTQLKNKTLSVFKSDNQETRFFSTIGAKKNGFIKS